MLPAWMAALKAHPEELWKPVWQVETTQYKWRRALPLVLAVEVVQQQRHALLENLRAEADGLQADLAALAAVEAAEAAGPPPGVQDMYDDGVL
jgi:hypothetical protein